MESLRGALRVEKPEIFNTDQGAQFTAGAFTSVLEEAGVQIGMDGRGRALDNVFVERLWRSVKYKDIYLNNYSNAPDLELGLERYFRFYNHERVHQGLDIEPRQRCILGMGNANQKSTLVLLNFGPKFGVKLRDKHRRMDRWKISICNTFIIYYVLINKDLCIK